jgi:hypothetical protein
MTIRTSEKTVTFTRPFVLGGFDEVLPAGAYSVESDKELLEGISFPAYRRILTLIRLHPKPGHPGLRQTWTIDPNELDAAQKRDQAPAEIRLESLPRQANRVRKKAFFGVMKSEKAARIATEYPTEAQREE